MSGFVLDASVALAWCFHDEATPQTWAVLERVRLEPAIVPALWPLELANILAGAERKARIAAADIVEFVALLAPLDIAIDETTVRRGLTDILALARARSITSYDAAYLDLAMREGLPLATRDRVLADAAERCGVAVVRC